MTEYTRLRDSATQDFAQGLGDRHPYIYASAVVGHFASQEFYMLLRSFAEVVQNCGDVSKATMTNMCCGVLWRFAETTNPHQNCAYKYQILDRAIP